MMQPRHSGDPLEAGRHNDIIATAKHVYREEIQ
jgi:hypothetical protein